MSFITDSQLLTRLAGVLKVDPEELPVQSAYWLPIVSDSRKSAWNDILGQLVGVRGYSQSQVASWDRGSEIEIDLGLFWCLVKGAGLHEFNDTFIKHLDRREELKTMPITIGGVVVAPGGAQPNISYGSLTDTQSTFYRQKSTSGEISTHDW